MRRGWGGAAAMAVAVLLGVTACTGDADPRPTGTVATTEPSPTEPGTPEPTATVPPLPPEATTQDAAGAQAFVRHWFDTLNFSYAAATTDALRSISDDGCESCMSFYELVEELADGGEHALGPALAVDEITSGPPEGSRALVILSYSEIPVMVADESGATRELPSGATYNAGAVLTWTGNAWVMTGLGEA